MAAAAAIAVGQKLEVFDDDVELAAFFALVVFPGVVAEAAFDEEGAALVAVLCNDLAAAPEAGELDEGDLFALLAGLRGVAAIMARPNSQTLLPEGSVLSSGSRVRLPMTMTLFILAITEDKRDKEMGCKQETGDDRTCPVFYGWQFFDLCP